MEIVELGGSVGSVWGEGKCNGKVTGWRSEEKYSELVFWIGIFFVFLFIFFSFSI